MDKKPTPVMMIDSSVLKDMFEGKKNGAKLLKKFNDITYKKISIKAYTPLASFLRAIYLADPKTKINSIQKTLNFLTIIPSFADFKNEEAVTEDMLKIAHIFSKLGQEEE